MLDEIFGDNVFSLLQPGHPWHDRFVSALLQAAAGILQRGLTPAEIEREAGTMRTRSSICSLVRIRRRTKDRRRKPLCTGPAALTAPRGQSVGLLGLPADAHVGHAVLGSGVAPQTDATRAAAPHSFAEVEIGSSWPAAEAFEPQHGPSFWPVLPVPAGWPERASTQGVERCAGGGPMRQASPTVATESQAA